VFVLPGVVIAAEFIGASPRVWAGRLVIGLAATCLIASANYVINEWLDREFDRFHPVKRERPSVTQGLTARAVYAEYALLAAMGLVLAWWVSPEFTWAAAALLGMGLVYNVRPLRTKERIYLDVLSESINNPIRLLLGWFIVTPTPLPPSSLAIAYWMGGAYLMGVKRYSEFRFIGDPELAGRYRRSFRFYTEEKLLISSLMYALCAASLGGVFLVKYRVELVLALPFLALMFAWYFHIGLKPDSAAQHPERMHREPAFAAYVVLVAAILALCLVVRLPFMDRLLANAFLVSRP
jgi:4-hydroxybenzoate polyprenyltransferase